MNKPSTRKEAKKKAAELERAEWLEFVEKRAVKQQRERDSWGDVDSEIDRIRLAKAFPCEFGACKNDRG